MSTVIVPLLFSLLTDSTPLPLLTLLLLLGVSPDTLITVWDPLHSHLKTYIFFIPALHYHFLLFFLPFSLFSSSDLTPRQYDTSIIRDTGYFDPFHPSGWLWHTQFRMMSYLCYYFFLLSVLMCSSCRIQFDYSPMGKDELHLFFIALSFWKTITTCLSKIRCSER